MIEKLERTQNTAKQNKELTLITPTNNGSNNKHWINISRITALEWTAAKPLEGLNLFY